METVTDFILGGSKITADGVCRHEIKIKLKVPWKTSYDQPRQHIKKHRHYFADKGPYSQSYGVSSSHVGMWELDLKKAECFWCLWTVVLEKTLESPLDSKEIQPVHPKGSQSWIFIGRTDAKGNSNTLATWCKELIHWKRPRCWERLKARGEGHDRGCNGWIASLTPWTWGWASSRSWWRTGKPGVLQSVGSQSWTRLNDWTELNWTEMKY